MRNQLIAAIIFSAASQTTFADDKRATIQELNAEVRLLIPNMQKQAIAETENGIKEIQKILKDPIIANGPSGPSYRDNLKSARARLATLKENPLEAAPVLSRRSGVDKWGRLPDGITVKWIGANSVNLELTQAGWGKVSIIGVPQKEWTLKTKHIPGIFFVDSVDRNGVPLTVQKLPIEKMK